MRWEQLWHRTKEALPLFTPEGELNTRARAEAVLAETLSQLPDAQFAKTKRLVGKAEVLSYLDMVQTQLAALPVAEELKRARKRLKEAKREAKRARKRSSAARKARRDSGGGITIRRAGKRLENILCIRSINTAWPRWLSSPARTRRSAAP